MENPVLKPGAAQEAKRAGWLVFSCFPAAPLCASHRHRCWRASLDSHPKHGQIPFRSVAGVAGYSDHCVFCCCDHTHRHWVFRCGRTRIFILFVGNDGLGRPEGVRSPVAVWQALPTRAPSSHTWLLFPKIKGQGTLQGIKFVSIGWEEESKLTKRCYLRDRPL